MATRFETLQGSVTGKVLFIGGLILLLLLPVGMIKGLIHERASLYDTARSNVASAWGASQTIGGPILVVPFQFTRMSYAQPVTITDELYLLPEQLELVGNVESEERFRGIYGVPVYTARLRVAGRFAPPALGGEYQDLTMLWDQAEIALPLTDARSVKEPIVLASGDATTSFQPGGTRVPGFGPQLVARYAELGLGALTASQAFSFELMIQGTETLRFLPLGDETRVSVGSDWASPSFSGAYLPDERSVTDAGFTAEWRVLDLGRGYASSWTRAEAAPQSVAASAFGVELITPVGIHEASMRAAKYAVLIIGLTFVAYFLFELLAALRLHALQYLLIGMANCVFYLLLLALAEHVGFAFAYLASATAATTLIAMYSAAVLRSLRRAVPIATLLAALYGYLYVTLRAEDYALLFGALGLFVVLAALMYLTRRVDWFAVSFGAPRDTGGGARVQLHAQSPHRRPSFAPPLPALPE
jgi:inner membrane protein